MFRGLQWILKAVAIVAIVLCFIDPHGAHVMLTTVLHDLGVFFGFSHAPSITVHK